jgi:hypothetical protein
MIAINDDTVPGKDNRKYVIVWKHRTNYGSQGKGTKQFNISDAALMAQELNTEFPHIHHTIELVNAPAQCS